jgi:hypothetical protein
MNTKEIKKKIEVLLFASSEPLSISCACFSGGLFVFPMSDDAR